MIEVETFQAIDGHIVVERDGELAVLDTGSPISLAAPKIVSQQLGRPIARLIGCEDIGGRALEVDWRARQLRWSPSRAAPDGAVPLHMSEFGVPLVDIGGSRGPAQAVFDTGAPIAYVPDALVAGSTALSRRSDFFPGLGEFTTLVYPVSLHVGGAHFVLECGVLPPLLAMALGLLCPGGYIVGSQLMQDRVTRFDLDAGWIQMEVGR
jgi:hypothetical protein